MSVLSPTLRAAALLLSLPCAAETLQVSAAHFEVRHQAVVDATPAQAWAAMLQLPRWWQPRHTWSGDARNLSLDAVAGGCWCERWGDGASAQHGRVLQVLPGRRLVVQAALGPLLTLPALGVFALSAAAQDGRTTLRLSYRVSGAPELALDTLASPVDEVLGAQFARLKALVETGAVPPP
ncbi:MAG: SRPBCC domain-containing protein [Rubrivivax sp.]